MLLVVCRPGCVVLIINMYSIMYYSHGYAQSKLLIVLDYAVLSTYLTEYLLSDAVPYLCARSV